MTSPSLSVATRAATIMSVIRVEGKGKGKRKGGIPYPILLDSSQKLNISLLLTPHWPEPGLVAVRSCKGGRKMCSSILLTPVSMYLAKCQRFHT